MKIFFPRGQSATGLVHERSRNCEVVTGAAMKVLMSLLMVTMLTGGAWLQAAQLLPFNPAADDRIHALAVQPDGRILVGGKFTMIGGKKQAYLARLFPDGRVDETFRIQLDAPINCIAIQPDNKILIAGHFQAVNETKQTHLARLEADGAVDGSFRPDPDFEVTAVAAGKDGKILVGGRFRHLAGAPCNYLGRLFPDGRLDTDFKPVVNSEILSLRIVEQGKIVIAGYFSEVNGTQRRHLARLEANGVLDSEFAPVVDGYVYALALDGGGNLLLGGLFSEIGGHRRTRIARLNPKGVLDTAFNPGIHDGPGVRVSTIGVQSDSKLIIGGYFLGIGENAITNIARLNPDGSVDKTFDLKVGDDQDNAVEAVALLEDGKFLVGGSFTNLSNEPRGGLALLATEEEKRPGGLVAEENKFLWERAGSSPELQWSRLEGSQDGVKWQDLGEGKRVERGWEFRTVSQMSHPYLRARGVAYGGGQNGSSWPVEAAAGKPLVMIYPARQTNQAMTTAIFSAAGQGSGPISYQWFRDGKALMEKGGVLGTATETLRLISVSAESGGKYSVTASNAFGMVSSTPAELFVNDPAIIAGPTNIFAKSGEAVSLKVEAAGTEPMKYQWIKNGSPVSGGNEKELTIENVQAKDAGSYQVKVENAHGSSSSEVMKLKVDFGDVDTLSVAANDEVAAVVVQRDGGMVLGGNFTKLGEEGRKYLGRVNQDGVVDEKFAPLLNDTVLSIAQQPDGKLLVGGHFTLVNEKPFSRLIRLNPDGSVDESFNPGLNDAVMSIVLQPDGKILIGGFFSKVAGQPRSRIARLNPDGSLDMEFNPDASFAVDAIALQKDGKIVIAGRFKLVGGKPHDYLTRLNADGSVDETFKAEANGWINSLAIDADGKIICGGEFTAVNGMTRKYLARMHPDGKVDESFDVEVNAPVLSIRVQQDHKILLGGDFTMVNQQPRMHLARLGADGVLDQEFNPGASHRIYSMTLQEDGKVIVAGRFKMLGGQPRLHIGRLN
ncbi:MAG: immunoglobulin domain-containing protein [Verrucomicrobiota bacterium]|nr:immunoglobulin domain-containing protein [Verrucomicrobiota bacterium]